MPDVVLRTGAANPTDVILYAAPATLTGITYNLLTASPLGGCTVHVFETANDLELGETISDGGGNFSITVPVNPPLPYYIVAYKKGSPDVFGTTLDTLGAAPSAVYLGTGAANPFDVILNGPVIVVTSDVTLPPRTLKAFAKSFDKRNIPWSSGWARSTRSPAASSQKPLAIATEHGTLVSPSLDDLET